MKRLTLSLLLIFAAATAFGRPGAQIQNGPYVHDVTEDGFTVVWTSDTDAIGWVEVAPDDGSNFYACERPKHFDTKTGIMHIGTLHRVRVEGLEPGTSYRYRVLQKAVLLNEGTRQVIFSRGTGSDVYNKEPLRVKTLDPAKEEVEFWVVNDIHARDSVFRKLMEGIDGNKTDFVVFNGDMLSSMESEKQMFEGYLQSASRILSPAGVPIVSTRGNHETRGAFAEHYLDYFPTRTGEVYYSFRHGPAYFVVMDCGEDKPENDIEYFGLNMTDSYREKEALWLKEVVQSDEYKAAPIHIVILHMAPGGKDSWHGELELRRLFGPVLNEAGVDVMLCGHYHEYGWIDDDSRGTNYPILVNSNNDKLVVKVDAGGIEIDVVDTDGNAIHHHSIGK